LLTIKYKRRIIKMLKLGHNKIICPKTLEEIKLKIICKNDRDEITVDRKATDKICPENNEADHITSRGSAELQKFDSASTFCFIFSWQRPYYKGSFISALLDPYKLLISLFVTFHKVIS